MKSKTVFLACVVLIGTGGAFGKYSGGTGEPNDPYRIATAEDLNDIGNHDEDLDKHFKLINHIYLGLYTGDSFNAIGTYDRPFAGVFDGNGCMIMYFTYSTSIQEFTGLFGVVSHAHIRNLTLWHPHVRAEAGSAGCLIGWIMDEYALVERCSVIGGDIWGQTVGGLVGEFSFGGLITGCCYEGAVSGGHSAAGLVGETLWVRVESSYSSGQVSSEQDAGGLVGNNVGIIENCYSRANVSGAHCAGGLVGTQWGDWDDLTNCYSTGQISGPNNVGGLVGMDEGGSDYEKCFWDMTVNPDVNGIGTRTDPNVIGKTTAEMMTESTFTDAGWDFVEVWGVGEGQTYPFLRVHSAGDLDHSGLVDWRDFAILGGHWLEGEQ